MLDVDRPAILRSGELRLDRTERQLWLGGRRAPLSGLPFKILELLMLGDGALVTRAELKAALWPYAIRIDTERRLNTAMRALREALAETAGRPSHIETVRGVGYRWIGGPEQAVAPAPSRSWAVIAAAFAIAASGGASSWQQPPAPQASVAIAEPDRSLAWRLVNMGRSDAARPQLATLIAAGAPDARSAADLGWLLLRAGNPEAALAICDTSQSISFNLLSCRQTAFARLGQLSAARQTALEIMRLSDAEPQAIAAVAQAPAPSGYARFLRWRIAHFVPPTGQWFQRAQLQADAGFYADALVSLRLAAAARDPLLVKIGSSAEFAPLRSVPEFRRLRDRAMRAQA